MRDQRRCVRDDNAFQSVPIAGIAEQLRSVFDLPVLLQKVRGGLAQKIASRGGQLLASAREQELAEERMVLVRPFRIGKTVSEVTAPGEIGQELACAGASGKRFGLRSGHLWEQGGFQQDLPHLRIAAREDLRGEIVEDSLERLGAGLRSAVPRRSAFEHEDDTGRPSVGGGVQDAQPGGGDPP